jgi:hypothetical protein
MKKTLFALAIFALNGTAFGQYDVTTQRNNNERTGAYLAETQLTPSSVSSGSFGRLYSQPVEGQIAAQPLYVRAVETPSGERHLVFVATRNNTVYAFDADRPANGAIWQAKFGPPPDIDPEMSRTCRQTRGVIGITSTPVIDRALNTMYIVSREGNPPLYHIHAIDIRTGTPVRETTIPNEGASDGFSAKSILNRAALLLVDGVLYLGFSAINCDNLGLPFHGYVMAYSAGSLQRLAMLNTTPDGKGGGVWQSGNGLAADTSGNIYFLTGNGTNSCDPNHLRGTIQKPLDGLCLDQQTHPHPPLEECKSARNNISDSIAKVRLKFVSLKTIGGFVLDVLDYFTPYTWQLLDMGDTDLGSGGPVLLPDGHLIGGGKEGRLYVLNRSTMQQVPQAARLTTPCPVNDPHNPDPDGIQAYCNTYYGLISPNDYACDQNWSPNIHGSPAFWVGSDGKGHLYAMPEKDHLRAHSYDLSSHQISVEKTQELRSPDGMPGGSQISLSANDSIGGVLWISVPKYDATFNIAPGRLVAVDAWTFKELWRDDSDISYAKFVPPTIADGKVFRATFGDELIVYGIGGQNLPLNCETTDIRKKYESYGGAHGLGNERFSDACPLRNCRFAFYDTYGSIYASQNPDGSFSKWSDGSEKGDENAEYAAIYTSPTTCAHVVRHAIETKWGAVKWNVPGREGLQWENGPLGLPTTDERFGVSRDLVESELEDGRRQWRYNLFEHGAVYAANLNATHIPDPHHLDKQQLNPHVFAVYNDRLADETIAPIYDKFVSFGGLEGPLGAPKTDTLATGDGVGRYAYFKGGSIYWSQNTGAHVVWGAILGKWAELGFERSPLGYPISDEMPTADNRGRLSLFQHGFIDWYEGRGAVAHW